MSDITDRDLLDLLLEHEADLTEMQFDAFRGMSEFVAEGRKLSEKQRTWAVNTATSKGWLMETSLNLHSSGKVPQGVAKPPTAGELIARQVLGVRPLAPPGRRA